MEIRRLFDILEHYKSNKPDQPVALAMKDDDGKWIKYSLADYCHYADMAAYALIELGIAPKDKVAIISTNRPEWNMMDMAVMKIGAITVPVYPNITEEDYRYILRHCEAKLLLIEGAEVMRKIEHILPDLPDVKYVYTFKDRGTFPYWDQFIRFGEEHPHPEELTIRSAEVLPEQCSTIMYTSGTTGTPKGVMLSHSNIVNQLLNLYHIIADWSHTALSFLPLCHAYERMLVFLYQYRGLSVYYARNLGTIAEDIHAVRPTMMSTVPLMLEKMFDKINQSGRQQRGIARLIFSRAIRLACRYHIEKSDRTLWYRMRHKVADRLVYCKIREAIGGDFDIVVSGAAMIRPHLVSFFSAIGMPVYEGYGMTETSPVIAVSCNEKYGREAGTVGFPLHGVEIAFTENNELICRGHNVMMGYYKDENLTHSVIDADGWMHTGDTGRFTDKGQVVITGRLKSLFKSSLGKYINASVIESKCSESPFVEHSVAFGDNQRFVVAVIVPDQTNLKDWCKSRGIDCTDMEKALGEPAVAALFQQEIQRCNEALSEAEKIKKFKVLSDTWSIANGMLTPTLKVKRGEVEKKYADIIADLYK